MTAVAPAASPPTGPELGDPKDKLTADVLKIAGVVVLGIIMSILDTTVVNVALPTFMADFQVAEYSTVAWTITGYTLALAAVIPVTGWAADRFGTKRLYVLALFLFTFGSVLCALAWNIQTLITFRVLQGLGGGMLMPLGMTILTKAAGPHRIGRLMAVMGVPMLLGPILGPILGGLLIDKVSWHWIFLINLPLGIAAIMYALAVLTPDSPEPSETFDFVGMLLMSPGLALFLYGVSSIPAEGTVAATKVLAPGIAGTLLIVAFVAWSFRPEHPLLDLRLFKDRNLTVTNIVMFLFAGSFFGALLLVPTYFQQVRGESVLMAGVLVAPQGLGAMLTMPLVGTLSEKIPVGRIVPFGFIGVIGGMAGLALTTDPDSPYWQIMAASFVLGLGMGATMMPLFTSALKTLRAHQVARGSTLLNVVQQIAASVGVASISVVLTNRQNASDALTALREISGAELAGIQPPVSATDIARGLGEALHPTALADHAAAFSTAYWIATAALVLTLIPVAFLPRKHEVSRLLEDEGGPTHLLDDQDVDALPAPLTVESILREHAPGVEESSYRAPTPSLLLQDGNVVDVDGHIVARLSAIQDPVLADMTDPVTILDGLARLQQVVEDDPRLAIGYANELCESTARVVLRARGRTFTVGDAFPTLARAAQESLMLSPHQTGDAAVGMILGGLSSVVSGLDELRSRGHGAGHDPTERPVTLPVRQARLAAAAAAAWCELLLDTLADQGAPWRSSQFPASGSPEVTGHDAAPHP